MANAFSGAIRSAMRCQPAFVSPFLNALVSRTVLHAFQKKDRRGIAKPKKESDTARRRLALAEARYPTTHG